MSRFRFTFWLDCSKDNELLIAEEIDDLKAKRLFSQTIRDGIRLIADLRQGRVGVLQELFPGLSMQGMAASTQTMPQSQGVGLRPPPELPRFDTDDGLTELMPVAQDESAGERATGNFMSSLMALQGM